MAVVMGAVLGGLAGVLLANLNSGSYQAAAVISIDADPTGSTPTQSADQVTAFIQAEVVQMESPSQQAAAGRAAGVAVTPKIAATQIGNTNLVRVVATASGKQASVAVANAVVTVYRQRRISSAQAAFDAGGATISRQLGQIRTQILALGAIGGAQATALSTEYARLLSQYDQLELTAAHAGDSVGLIQPADVAKVQASSPTTVDAAIGVLVGALLGLGAGLVLLRTESRLVGLGSVADLLTSDVTAFDLPRLGWSDGSPPDDRHRGSTAEAHPTIGLLCRYLMPSPTAGPPVLVVGNTSGVGTSTVALELARASAQRAPTLLFTAGDVLKGDLQLVSKADRAPSVAAGLAETDPGDLSAQLRNVVRETDVEGLWVLSAADLHRLGDTEVPASESLVRAASGLGKQLAELGKVVVIDSPPLDSSTFAMEIAPDAHAVVLVVGEGISSPGQLRRSMRALQLVRPDLAAVVRSHPRHSLWRRPRVRMAT